MLTACGQEENNESGMQSVNDLNLDPLDAELLIPEEADPGEEVSLQVLVTQGEEQVDDASEVTFEVWMDGEKSESQMIEAELPGEEGVYEITHLFTEEKVYYIQPHVTARGSHVMPVGEIIVGDATVEEESGEENGHIDASDDHEESNHENGGHNDSLHEHLDLRWTTEEQASVNEEVTLSVEVDWKDDAWTDGRTQFEVWKHGDEQHEWLAAVEADSGSYETVHVFEETGEYHIIVHLEDEEIHEHVQFSIEIE